MTRTILFVVCLSLVTLTVYAAQYARPDSDDSNDYGWLDQHDATPLWDDLDEATAADTDYAWKNNAADAESLRLGLTGLSDPYSSSGHVMRVRTAKLGGSRNCSLLVWLRCGSTTIATLHTGQFWGWETDTYTLSSAEADAITDYSALSVTWFLYVYGGGAPPDPGVSWFEFEVPDAGAPTYRRRVIISE